MPYITFCQKLKSTKKQTLFLEQITVCFDFALKLAMTSKTKGNQRGINLLELVGMNDLAGVSNYLCLFGLKLKMHTRCSRL